MSDPDLDVATSNQPVARFEVAPPPSGSQPRARDPGIRSHAEGDVTLPFAGQPGHGRAASLRRQPVRIVDGRIERGYSNAFELICPACGDNPDLDYSQVSPRLQWLRVPRTLQAALAAYEKHCPNEREALDCGHITSPLAGRLPLTPDTAPGAGLWLANQLCDLVQIYSSPGRTAIRLHQNL
jgi:hypothetical protein